MKKLTDKDITELYGLIMSIVSKYSFFADKDDLLSEGYVGLCQAARKFKKNNGSTFKGFAYRYIRGRIIDYLRKENKYHEHIVLMESLDGLDGKFPDDDCVDI